MSKQKNNDSNTKTLNTKEEIKKQVRDCVDEETQNLEEYAQTEAKKNAYFVGSRDGCLYRRKDTKKEPIPIRLANFIPRINQKIIYDDGACESKRQMLLMISGMLCGKRELPEIEVPIEKYSNLNWISTWLPYAQIEPGNTTREHILAYTLKALPADFKVTTYYSQTGWRFINNKMVFLHGGGAVGADQSDDIKIKFDQEIARYCLPTPPPSSDQEEVTEFSKKEKEALRMSFDFLDIATKEITYPLFSAIWLAPLCSILDRPVNFSYFLSGPPRSMKTTIALAALSFYGKFQTQQHLANFNATPTALEIYSFRAADVPCVIDDWAPSASKVQAEKKANLVNDVIRNFANRSNRWRAQSNISAQDNKPPRGLLIITSELLPNIESIITRIVTLEFTRSTINLENLKNFQKKASLLPYAMRAYISWLSENIDDVKKSFRERFVAIREKAMQIGCDARISEHISFQLFAWETALTFFISQEIINDHDAEVYIKEAWDQFINLSKSQEAAVKAEDPVEIWMNIIITFLIQGEVRLEPHPKSSVDRVGDGEMLGWHNGKELFLLPDAAWGVVNAYYKKSNSYFPISNRTAFFKMLKDRKIVQIDPEGNATRKETIGGRGLRVLKVIDADYIENSLANREN